MTVERSLLEREPDAVRLHLRLAHALLMEGRLDEGWAEYEWRLRQPGFEWGTKGLPRWDGSDPARHAIRVVTEQGLGDAMLFARFVRELARRGRACSSYAGRSSSGSSAQASSPNRSG